jgi:cobalt-zinc-cadmium efflux system membrane fusion protein
MKSKKSAKVLAVGLVGIALALMPVEFNGLTTSYAIDEHRERDDEHIVKLSKAELEEFGIEIATAGSGKLRVSANLSGGVVVNPDRLAHIVPRVPGVVRKVYKKLGDRVRESELMAVLESRELSELKSTYLVGKERVALAAATFQREERLWTQKISSQREYLTAKQALAEARIEMRAAEQKLHALGFSHAYLADLSFQTDELFTRYEITAPFDATLIEKHIVLGEVLKGDAEAFVIADLSTVWVNLTVYQQDLALIHIGQSVQVTAGPDMPAASGLIEYISPVVDEQTRAATARVELPNSKGDWRPGSFVHGRVVIEDIAVSLLLPKTALQTVENQISVFVETAEGFETQPVTTGRSNETHVEITSGLHPGQRYVAQGSFTLKAQLSKDAFARGHQH